MNELCRFDLRTTDAVAARAFYATLLGHDRSNVWPLHEQALARGARPHWLGRLAVDDVERKAAALVQRGATQFGPMHPTADGGHAVVLRDPGGAIVAVGTPPSAATPVDVVWHVLNTNDAALACATYRELFGWEIGDRTDLGAPFAWHAGGENVGIIADIAGRPSVHPHWLFFFEVESVDSAIAAVRAGGGTTLQPLALPTGERFCACDDPQGAAFGLRSSPRRSMGR